MVFGAAIYLIQAVDGWGREPPSIPDFFTCLDCSLTLPQIVLRHKSIKLISQGQADQQLRWVGSKLHGIWGGNITDPGHRWMREGTPGSTRNFHLFRLLNHVPSPQFDQSLYADYLSWHLGLNETRLKPELTFSILLNPLYGLQKRIDGAGLLTPTQYSRTRWGRLESMYHLLIICECLQAYLE